MPVATISKNGSENTSPRIIRSLPSEKRPENKYYDQAPGFTRQIISDTLAHRCAHEHGSRVNIRILAHAIGVLDWPHHSPYHITSPVASRGCGLNATQMTLIREHEAHRDVHDRHSQWLIEQHNDRETARQKSERGYLARYEMGGLFTMPFVAIRIDAGLDNLRQGNFDRAIFLQRADRERHLGIPKHIREQAVADAADAAREEIE